MKKGPLKVRPFNVAIKKNFFEMQYHMVLVVQGLLWAASKFFLWGYQPHYGLSHMCSFYATLMSSFWPALLILLFVKSGVENTLYIKMLQKKLRQRSHSR